MRYRFADFTLDLDAGTLVGAQGEVRLRRKTFDLLCAFVGEPACVLSKDKLLDAVWGAVHLHQDSLSQAVSELRRALGDDAKTPRYIETVHGRGYRFIHPIEVIDRVTVADEPDAALPAATAIEVPEGEVPEGEVPAEDAAPAGPKPTGLTRPKRRWPTSRLLGGLALVLLGFAVVYATRTETAGVDGAIPSPAGPIRPASPRIALLDLVDEGAGEPSWLTTAVPALLGSQLARHVGVYVYPRNRLQIMQADLASGSASGSVSGSAADSGGVPSGARPLTDDDVRAIHRYLDADVVIAGTVQRWARAGEGSDSARSMVTKAQSVIALQVFAGASARATLTRRVEPYHEDLGWQLQRLGKEIADHLGLGDVRGAGALKHRQGARPTPPLGPAEQYFTALRVSAEDPARALALLRAASEQEQLARIAAAERDVLLRLGDHAGALDAAREARNLSRGHGEEVIHDLLAGHPGEAIDRLRRAEQGLKERDLEMWLRVLGTLLEARDLGRLFSILDQLAATLDGPLDQSPRASSTTRGAWLEAELALIEARAAALAGDRQRQTTAARRAVEAAERRGQRGVLEQALTLEIDALANDPRPGS